MRRGTTLVDAEHIGAHSFPSTAGSNHPRVSRRAFFRRLRGDCPIIASRTRPEYGMPLTPGCRVNFAPTDNGSYELTRATGSITALKNLLARAARPVTLEQMDTAIAEAAVERLAR